MKHLGARCDLHIPLWNYHRSSFRSQSLQLNITYCNTLQQRTELEKFMTEVLDRNLLIAATWTELAGAYCGTLWQTVAILCYSYCAFSYIQYINQQMYWIKYSTGLLKMIVGVLTTCHTQYTWDTSTCIFLFNFCYIR